MPKGYNALRNIQVNHLEAGICPTHGYLLTSEQCNCYPKETALMFAAEQTKNIDWKEQADRLHDLLNPLCKKCQQGCQYYESLLFGGITYKLCNCCLGDYLNCHNCTEEALNVITSDVPHPVDEKHAVDEASDLEYSESYRRFLEANKPKEDAVDYGI